VLSKAFCDGMRRHGVPASVATQKKMKNPRWATEKTQKPPGQISMWLAYIFAKNPTFPGKNPTFPEKIQLPRRKSLLCQNF